MTKTDLFLFWVGMVWFLLMGAVACFRGGESNIEEKDKLYACPKCGKVAHAGLPQDYCTKCGTNFS